MANKIKYGISKCYYAKITATDNDGVPTYGTPVAMPGAVSISLSAEGEMNPFHADNVIYYSSTSNNGYTGSLELALIPDSFFTDIMGDTAGQNGIVGEYANVEPAEFALLFQFEGDDKASRVAIYRCTASRPDVASQTKEASVTPVTETIELTCMPRLNDYLVKGKALDGASAYANWFTSVQLPS